MFFATKNLVEQTMVPCIPWEFVSTERITAQIRGSKEDRQAWYNNPRTAHQFYTSIEPWNAGARPSKANPPHKLHAFSADFDACIPEARVAEAVAAMKIKPAW